jgi:hypothetical protein
MVARDSQDSAGRLDIVVGDLASTRNGVNAGRDRTWLGIQFDCCGVYARIYRLPDSTAYVGACPHCRRTLRVPIGPGGTSQRIFRAG